MALRATRFETSDAEVLILGRFLLAVNALDVAMEDAIIRLWRISDGWRFRRIFFYKMAAGEKLRILRSSLDDDPVFRADAKAIDKIIELRNVVAHNEPETEYELIDDTLYQLEDGSWDYGVVDEFTAIGPRHSTEKPTSLDRILQRTAEVGAITGRISKIQPSIKPSQPEPGF